MKPTLFVTLMMLSTQLLRQNTIPVGTILPVQLNSSLRSDKVRPGQEISAEVTQDVPLPGGRKIHAGAKVIGHVVSARPAVHGMMSDPSLRFDTLAMGRQRFPLTTNLRALATMMDVSEAQVPESGPDRATSASEWITDQIGGEVVYRGGVVTHGSNIVGNSVGGSGVMAHLRTRPGTNCRGEKEGNDQMQALWVFSSDACGLYDFPKLTLAHAGRTDPVGQIKLSSDKGNVKVPGGSGMLLRVNAIAPWTQSDRSPAISLRVPVENGRPR